MNQKIYVVEKGRTPGIYYDWATCEKQVKGYPNSKFKSFKTELDAIHSYINIEDCINSEVKCLNCSDVSNFPAKIKIFSRGAYSYNSNKTGCGIAILKRNTLHKLWHGGFALEKTCNEVELKAFGYSLKKAKYYTQKGCSVAIFSNSEYAIKCITEYAVQWERNAWRKPKGEIKNLELIKEIYSLYKSLPTGIKILHLKKNVQTSGYIHAERMAKISITMRQKTFTRHKKPEVH